MSIDPRFAIKKDIQNNPVVRGADDRQRQEYLRTALLAVLAVGALVLAMLPLLGNVVSGYRIEQLRSELQTEQSINRTLRVSLEAQRAPKDLERRARALGMRPATLEDVTVIEIVPQSAMPAGVVASANLR